MKKLTRDQGVCSKNDLMQPSEQLYTITIIIAQKEDKIKAFLFISCKDRLGKTKIDKRKDPRAFPKIWNALGPFYYT